MPALKRLDLSFAETQDKEIYDTYDGIYVNYYRDGNDFLPQHSHPDTIQLVISLGATRDLKVTSKTYSLQNGDCITFGVATYGIAKQPTVTEGRISIACFMRPS